MIIKVLGIVDILAAVFFWIFVVFHISSLSFLVTFFAFYLLIKGIAFLISADIASILDVICSIIMFLAVSSVIPTVLVFLVTIFLLQKGIFSLLS